MDPHSIYFVAAFPSVMFVFHVGVSWLKLLFRSWICRLLNKLLYVAKIIKVLNL